MKKLLISLLTALNLTSYLAAQFNLKSTTYYDSRKCFNATISARLEDFYHINSLGHIDFYSTFGKNSRTLDKISGRILAYTENLFGSAIEYSEAYLSNESELRLGIVYHNKYILVSLLPYTTKGEGLQLGLSAEKYFKDWFVEGFADFLTSPKKLISELQIGRKLTDSLSAVVELRYDQLAVAVGVESKW